MDTRFQFCPYFCQSDQEKGHKHSVYNLHQKLDEQDNNFLSPTFDVQGTFPILQPDETLMERFEIKNQLGRGRSCVVYRAKDILRSTEVALKVVEVSPLNNEMASLQFKHEINTNHKISDHKYVIRVCDLHFLPRGGSDILVLSMEYANGGTFKKWLLEHSHDLKIRRTIGLDYIKQTCKGLGVAHDANVTHLALKPANLLFIDNILKISGFGTSGNLHLPAQSNGISQKMPLLDKEILYYMSPEHFTALYPFGLDPRADIYSLGIILYELFHSQCRPPFQGAHDRLREFHLKVPAPKLPKTDENLASIVARCLEKDPDDRYQSVWELLEDLEKECCSSIGPAIPEDFGTNGLSNELENNWGMASFCFSQDDYNEASRLTEKVLSINPEHAQARQLRDELQSKYEQAELFYQDISQNLETGDLSDLTGFLQEAIRIYPNHPSGRLVQTKIAAKVKKYRHIMEQGLLKLHQEHWESALDLFQQALHLHKGASQLKHIIELLIKLKDMRQNITQALSEKDFERALFLARSVDLQVKEMKQQIPAFRENMEDDN